jgi:hypothetical protein
MLKSWVANKERIKAQKRGSFQAYQGVSYVKELVIEGRLNTEFEGAQEQG